MRVGWIAILGMALAWVQPIPAQTDRQLRVGAVEFGMTPLQAKATAPDVEWWDWPQMPGAAEPYAATAEKGFSFGGESVSISVASLADFQGMEISSGYTRMGPEDCLSRVQNWLTSASEMLGPLAPANSDLQKNFGIPASAKFPYLEKQKDQPRWLARRFELVTFDTGNSALFFASGARNKPISLAELPQAIAAGNVKSFSYSTAGSATADGRKSYVSVWFHKPTAGFEDRTYTCRLTINVKREHPVTPIDLFGAGAARLQSSPTLGERDAAARAYVAAGGIFGVVIPIRCMLKASSDAEPVNCISRATIKRLGQEAAFSLARGYSFFSDDWAYYDPRPRTIDLDVTFRPEDLQSMDFDVADAVIQDEIVWQPVKRYLDPDEMNEGDPKEVRGKTIWQLATCRIQVDGSLVCKDFVAIPLNKCALLKGHRFPLDQSCVQRQLPDRELTHVLMPQMQRESFLRVATPRRVDGKESAGTVVQISWVYFNGEKP